MFSQQYDICLQHAAAGILREELYFTDACVTLKELQMLTSQKFSIKEVSYGLKCEMIPIRR